MPESKTPRISMEHIHKTFNPGSVNEVTVFDDFNLTIPHGQFVTVVGSNGSGKTTMLNLLCGSIPVDSGKMIVDGVDITNIPEYKRSTTIGRVYQDPSKGTCASMTILENMALADNKGKGFGLGLGVDKRRKDFYRSQLTLLGMGLEDKLAVSVGALSGGQRQALALLLATMTPLDLLILDEHTAALDPASSETVMALTDRFVKEKGLTTLMVTHNLKFAVNYGNRLLMMYRGQAILDLFGEARRNVSIKDLTDKFTSISIEDGNNM